MRIGPHEFDIPFFRENGFVRNKCDVCGSHFWTQAPDRKVCGDAPCEEYSFIGKPPTKIHLGVKEMRELFLSFFEKRGHKVIKPYPVVARWRDDVYLVGASIFNFQPYVTEGIMPPPANPLVVSQPCIRFTDIDYVGLTMGRHLTIFEMGGHHAFNYPDKDVYWKDETIRYHHELLTEKLGVKSELVTYKEHFWSGGGNAGPDVEACVQGLEISTLVFMQFKVLDDTLLPLPIRTVDTGYGMERWSWLSMGSPTGFHAVYGPIVSKVLDMASIRVEDRIAVEATKLSGMMDVAKMVDRSVMLRLLAERLGVEWKELEVSLGLLESAFAAIDHSKTIAFLLAEGVVPSNIEEGYLARLAIRRALRMLRAIGIEDRLPEIVEMQLRYWGEDFPHLKEASNQVLEILSAEMRKYKRTMERGGEIVKKISSELRAKGINEMPLDKLMELYDSHGLSPDFVKEVAEAESIKVSIPGDFFGKIAAKHARPIVAAPEMALANLKARVEGMPPTRRIYYEDAYVRDFDAQVLQVIDEGGDRYVVLDATAFYAEGGGQPADHGIMAWDGGEAKVVDVQLLGNVIVHKIEGRSPPVNARIKGKVDWDRRISLMRHHTATHITLGAARRVLGEHVWQAGAQKGVESNRIDISHYDRITEEQVAEMERIANEVVLSNLPVEVSWMPRDKAEAEYGFRLYQGGVVPGRDIRVVGIASWDVEACGGTHVRTTGEIGLIKVLKTERVQDGVERIIFVAGLKALKAFQDQEAVLKRVSKALGAPVEALEDSAKLIAEEKERLSQELSKATNKLIEYQAREVLSEAKDVNGLRLAVAKLTEGEERDAIKLATTITELEPAAIAVAALVKENAQVFVSAGKAALKRGIHAGRLASKLARVIGGGGGGKDYFGQGGGTLVDKVDDALKELKALVISELEG